MKINKKIICGVFGSIFCLCNLFCYDLHEVLSEQTAAELESKGSLRINHLKEKNLVLKLIPETDLCEETRSFWPKENGEPVLVGENVYLISKKKLNEQNPEAVTIEKSSEVIRSISKMQGMQYFSSKKKWETLYKEAHRIENAASKVKVPDDISGSAEGKSFYCLLNDNSLGKTNYSVNYRQTENEVSIKFSNVSNVSIGPIKAIENGNLNIGLVITDLGDDLLIYMIVQAKYPSVSMLENKLNKSFESRLDAIYNWFIKQF